MRAERSRRLAKAGSKCSQISLISLRNPTVQNLKLCDGPSVREVLDALDAREVPTIRPRVIMDGDTRRVLMPGDPGYY